MCIFYQENNLYVAIKNIQTEPPKFGSTSYVEKVIEVGYKFDYSWILFGDPFKLKVCVNENNIKLFQVYFISAMIFNCQLVVSTLVFYINGFTKFNSSL